MFYGLWGHSFNKPKKKFVNQTKKQKVEHFERITRFQFSVPLTKNINHIIENEENKTKSTRTNGP